MYRQLIMASAVSLMCSCQQIEGLMNQAKGGGEEKPAENSGSNESAKSNYDAKASLKAMVPAEVKAAYVDPAKAAVGSTATRDMGNNQSQTVAVVGEKGGNKIVELTSSFMKDYASNTPAVIALEVDSSGKVLKAWGGLVGADAVELPVPTPPKPVEAKGGEKVEVKTKKLDDITVVGVKASGLETTTKHGSSKTWTNEEFPFFSGVMKMEAGPTVLIISDYKKSGAKAQLKLK
ncbi:MAG: hypothetical protein NE327_09630 [Lentisphaeraceae bacterium]|nr:hypothetical protein [Lentisphaeraceae bacterium]